MLPIAFPVSLRRADDPLGGNRFAGARIAGPIGTADPRDRIRLIRERVLEARDEPALDFMAMLSPVLSRIPAPMLTRMTERVTSEHRPAGVEHPRARAPRVHRRRADHAHVPVRPRARVAR